MNFPTQYDAILNRIKNINPVSYARDRNYINGSVSYLSPYISRGVISTRDILNSLLDNNYPSEEMEKFLQELAWREYFQRVWQSLGNDIFGDIRHTYTGTKHRLFPSAVSNASTGILAIDEAIQCLYKKGYLHNHNRMYIASIVCNIGKAYWQLPSQWMYYHLLDGDIASNTCSWQWVAGSFSSKKYYCNQENINRYTRTNQKNTFLDKTYQDLAMTDMPKPLENLTSLKFNTNLPATHDLQLNPSLPLLIYNSYNLDPLWRKDVKANRVLLLEPSHFKEFPVSEKVIDFIVALAKNIHGIQVFTGEVNQIPGIRNVQAIYSKEHPAFIHYPGNKDERDWLFPEVKGFYNSFFSYWKVCKQQLEKRTPKSESELQRA